MEKNMFCIKYGTKYDAGSEKRMLLIVAKIARVVIPVVTMLSLAFLISLPVFAVESNHGSSMTTPPTLIVIPTPGGIAAAAQRASGSSPTVVLFVLFALIAFLIIHSINYHRKNKGTNIPYYPPFATMASAPAQRLSMSFFKRFSKSETALIREINQWLTAYPQMGNISCDIDVGSSLGFFVNKFTLKSVTFRYDVLPQNNTFQYAFIHLERTGLYRKKTKDVLAAWQANNPHAIVVQTSGGTNMRGSAGSILIGGIGAANRTQLYVFVKFPSYHAASNNAAYGDPGYQNTQQQNYAGAGNQYSQQNYAGTGSQYTQQSYAGTGAQNTQQGYAGTGGQYTGYGNPSLGNFCPYCGTKTEPGGIFCRQCGKNLI